MSLSNLFINNQKYMVDIVQLIIGYKDNNILNIYNSCKSLL